MLEYIYFVKCPGCEDEPFNFFNEAKEFAMSLLSQKPIITQIEVDRNDFGECTDSCDLGTVWSWEEMMQDVDADTEPITFCKADTLECDSGFDPELDALDNSLDSVPDNFRKPVPADMSIKDLVEEMEANEDTIECAGCEELFPKDDCFYKEGIGWLCSDCEDKVVKCGWCEELFNKSECRYEVDLGWLCDRCQAGIASRGEPLTFRENTYWDFLDESFNPKDKVEFIYDSLAVTLQGPKRAADDWDEAEDSVRHNFYKTKEDVATDIWENFIEEADVKDVDGGLETLEDDKAWADFVSKHFDDLLDKYYDKLLKYYEDDARKEYEETNSLNEAVDPHDLVELEYPSLTVVLYGEKRTEDDWEETEHTDSHVFLVPKVEVATAIWENWITEEDVKDVEGGLEVLEDAKAWETFLETHFDSLFEKYNKQILEYFKEEATEDFRERSQEEYSLNQWQASNRFEEGCHKQKPFLEEFDDAETHKASLIDCPECGSVSYDIREQYCTNCGLNL